MVSAFPKFRCQLCAVLDVVAEHGVQFRRCLLVEDESVRLVVVTEAAAVQVGGADGAEQVVDHHYFRMVESSVVHINCCPPFHQLMQLVKCGIRRERDVGGGRNHNCYVHSPVDCPVERFLIEEVGTK